jgi:hypothetical protein
LNHTIAGDLSSVGATLVQTGNANFASFYDKNEAKALKGLETFIEKMME